MGCNMAHAAQSSDRFMVLTVLHIYLRFGSVFQNSHATEWVLGCGVSTMSVKKMILSGKGEKKNSAFNVQYPLHLLLSWKHC